MRNEYRGIELTAEDEQDCTRKAEAGSHRLFMRDGNAITGETIAIKDGSITLQIPAYDSRLVLVE
ncbi:MAG: hypothetical protein IJS08_11025 [Victivallales bacterium]|nr:hypothetical protein [Victivallales bacterium]